MVSHPDGGVLEQAQEGQAPQAVPWRLRGAHVWGRKTWLSLGVSLGEVIGIIVLWDPQ